MHRTPAVAGHFYPARPADLTREIDRYLEATAPPQPALACIVPHAGIMYSGHVAGAVYARLELPCTSLLLGPNHSGVGRPLAILSAGEWETPLGNVPVDSELAAELKRACPRLEEDDVAHRFEHSLEVQLPFLQRRRSEIRLVPVAVGVGSYEPLAELGEAIAHVLASRLDRPLLIASSDLNHYESDEISRRKDRQAIDRILALDPRGLYDTVRQERISMCGFGPTVSVLTAARALGAKEAELVRYANSGDINGDRTRVVGYAGIVIR